MHLAVLIWKLFKYYLKVFKYLCRYLVFKYYKYSILLSI